MLGKLSLAAIPFDNPIIMGAVAGSLIIGLVILALITRYGKWRYLWDEWLTSVDHKRIGVMYVILAMVMLLRGFSDAIMMRAPGMTLMRMPIFVWTALVTCVLIILSFPVITVALGMLGLDRYLGMHFFTNAMGGNMMMYANLFWIWGHPEVYILILPAFGIYSEVVPTYSRKPLFGYKTMVYATAAIGLLSFTVWLHHFFTMGSNADVNAIFGITTMIIAVPTGVKIFNWLFTMYRGRVEITNPIRWTLGFFSAFTIGGVTGVLLAMPAADYMMHNSVFLVAHFHNMLIPGALFAFFAGYEYWFPKAFGFTLNEKWGKRAFWSWLVGFYVAFMPLYALGFMGMPRRLDQIWNPAWGPWLVAAAIGAAIILCGIVFQIVQLAVSIRERRLNLDGCGSFVTTPSDGKTAT